MAYETSTSMLIHLCHVERHDQGYDHGAGSPRSLSQPLDRRRPRRPGHQLHQRQPSRSPRTNALGYVTSTRRTSRRNMTLVAATQSTGGTGAGPRPAINTTVHGRLTVTTDPIATRSARHTMPIARRHGPTIVSEVTTNAFDHAGRLDHGHIPHAHGGSPMVTRTPIMPTISSPAGRTPQAAFTVGCTTTTPVIQPDWKPAGRRRPASGPGGTRHQHGPTSGSRHRRCVNAHKRADRPMSEPDPDGDGPLARPVNSTATIISAERQLQRIPTGGRRPALCVQCRFRHDQHPGPGGGTRHRSPLITSIGDEHTDANSTPPAHARQVASDPEDRQRRPGDKLHVPTRRPASPRGLDVRGHRNLSGDLRLNARSLTPAPRTISDSAPMRTTRSNQVSPSTTNDAEYSPRVILASAGGGV